MAEPQFDRTTGRWYIRVRQPDGSRVKTLLPKHPGWTKLAKRPRTTPPEVLAYARPFQDREARLRVGLPVEPARATPLGPFLAEYEASYALAGTAPRSRVALATALRLFREYCERAGVATVQGVTVATCRGFLDDGARAGKGFNRLRTLKGLLSPAFRRAEVDGLVPRNPWSRLAVPGRRPRHESMFWTDDEVAKIEAKLSGWARDIFLVGIHSGFRIAGLRHLRWRDVIRDDPRHPQGSLWCRVAKGDKPYRIPLFPKLRDVLDARQAAAGDVGPDAWVFPGAGGKPISVDAVDYQLMRAMERAGVEDRGRRCHAMRETFGTRCAARGVHPRTIQKWMNHASLTQTMKYMHFDHSKEGSEVSKMGDADGADDGIDGTGPPSK